MPKAPKYNLTYSKESAVVEEAPVRRIYLAARYARREEILVYAKFLSANGFGITSRWINGNQEQWRDENLYLFQARIAQEDIDDILASDCCLSFTDLPPKKDQSLGSGGRNVELGLALGAGKKCVIIGPREHIFHHLPKIDWFQNWVFFCECLNLQFSWLDIQRRKK